MKKILLLIAAAFSLLGCSRSKALLPSVSGKAGEVIVVIDKSNWESSLGNEVRGLLACECPWLPTKEPLYSLVNVAPGGFTDLFKVHRNIVIMNINPQGARQEVLFKHDVWSSPQCVIQVNAADSESAIALIGENGPKIVAAIEQAERDRVIHNSILYEERNLAPQVSEIFGGSPHFPMGYSLKKKTSDFVWIADEKQFTTQGIFVYRYPAGEEGEFSLAKIIAHRNDILKRNVPGMFENTYMTTGAVPAPSMEFLKFRKRDFVQVRGWWEVENDYMGGPFVSQSFYSLDGKYIIVAEAFVYAPKYDKRQYLRQVESIIYSWDWKNVKEDEK